MATANAHSRSRALHQPGTLGSPSGAAGGEERVTSKNFFLWWWWWWLGWLGWWWGGGVVAFLSLRSVFCSARVVSRLQCRPCAVRTVQITFNDSLWRSERLCTLCEVRKRQRLHARAGNIVPRLFPTSSLALTLSLSPHKKKLQTLHLTKDTIDIS